MEGITNCTNLLKLFIKSDVLFHIFRLKVFIRGITINLLLKILCVCIFGKSPVNTYNSIALQIPLQKRRYAISVVEVVPGNKWQCNDILKSLLNNTKFAKDKRIYVE